VGDGLSGFVDAFCDLLWGGVGVAAVLMMSGLMGVVVGGKPAIPSTP